MGEPTYEDLAKQLSAGLDLCIRARNLDAQERTNVMVEAFPEIDMERCAPRLNANFPDQPYTTKSHTIAAWVQQQYDVDLAAWERETKAMLVRLNAYGFSRGNADPV